MARTSASKSSTSKPAKAGAQRGEAERSAGSREGKPAKAGAQRGEAERSAGSREGKPAKAGAQRGEAERSAGSREGKPAKAGAQRGEAERSAGSREGKPAKAGAQRGEAERSAGSRQDGARSEPQASGARTVSEERPGFVLIGRLASGHGLKGELRLDCFAEGLETLRGVTRLRVEGERPDAPDLVLEVRSLAPARGGVRLRLAGVDSRDAADALRGRQVWADAGELEALPEGEHYGHELIGCALVSEDGAALGTVRDVWRTGAPDVLVVEAPDGRELLVPAALLREVDAPARRAVVEVLPGLLDSDEGA